MKITNDIHRRFFVLPEPDEWMAILGPAFQASQRSISRLSAPIEIAELDCCVGQPRPLKSELSSQWHPLWHELSPMALQRAARGRFVEGKSQREALILESFTRYFAPAINDPDSSAFVSLIEEIGKELSPLNGGFRTNRAQFLKDAAGVRVLFPSSERIKPRLSELHGYLRTHLPTQPLFAATVAMVAITNCHPFRDGNGRTSRLLFNGLLRFHGLAGNTYIPLYEIFWASGCGFEIRMRIAELRNDWAPLCGYMGNVISLICRTRV